MARRPPKPKPASRPRPRPASGAGRTWLAWLILLALIAGVGVWMYRQRPAHRPAPAPLAASACGPVLADLGGHALARSKAATFTTIEQLQRQAPAGPSSAYRVEARLLQTSAVGDQYRLLLGSLVSPSLTMTALLPAGHCAANRDDGALFDELRQDINLQFGPLAAQPSAPAHPAQVVVTGIVAVGPSGLELRPVLDFRVQ